MEYLKSIWPSLGTGGVSFPRNKHWTKSGPGRTHNHLTAAQQKIKDMTGVDVTRL